LLDPYALRRRLKPSGPQPWFPGWSHLCACRDPLLFLEQTSRKYPDIAYVELGSRRDYLLFHPDYIREALLGTEGQLLRGFNPILRRIMGRGLLSSQGEFHRSQRQSTQPIFHRQQVGVFSEIMVRQTEAFSSRWQDRTELDIAHEMLGLSFAIIVDLLFGAEASEARALGQVVDQAIRMTGRKGYLRRYLASRTPFFGEDELEKTIRELDRIVYALIAQQRRAAAAVPTMLSLLLDIAAETGQSDKQVRDEAMTLLFAGHETIATALTWTWYLLSQNRREECKLHEEIDRVLGQRSPTIADLPKLSHTSAVLHEAMRLYPPVWLIVRRPVNDWKIGEYVVPARSYLYLSPYVVHRDARFFSNPERFAPSRWSSPENIARHKFAYFPFGGGGRKCIGDYFATAEGILILASIARRWKMRPAGKHPVEPTPLVTLRPKHGIRMKLLDRQARMVQADTEETIAAL
jgi:cytochrome P450